MQIIKTDKYPTRYTAFDNPRAFVINSKPDLYRPGCELAVYHAPMVNAAYPHLTDGVYISVFSYQGKGIILDYHFTAPNRTRRQKNKTEKFANDQYQDAIRRALQLAGYRGPDLI